MLLVYPIPHEHVDTVDTSRRFVVEREFHCGFGLTRIAHTHSRHAARAEMSPKDAQEGNGKDCSVSAGLLAPLYVPCFNYVLVVASDNNALSDLGKEI